jgi:multimeric flavodoxin WrbA
VKAVLAGAEDEGAETELVDIYSLHIDYCTACGTCYATGECILLDDFPDLFDRMMNAEGIVLGAPNYIDSVPAPIKALFDRMADAIHCQMLTGKFGCSVCTTGGSVRGLEFRDHLAGLHFVRQLLQVTVKHDGFLVHDSHTFPSRTEDI